MQKQYQYANVADKRYEQWDASESEARSYGRAAATLGGALLAIYGLTRNSTPGLGLAAAGGAILYRALNGSWSPPSAVSRTPGCSALSACSRALPRQRSKAAPS